MDWLIQPLQYMGAVFLVIVVVSAMDAHKANRRERARERAAGKRAVMNARLEEGEIAREEYDKRILGRVAFGGRLTPLRMRKALPNAIRAFDVLTRRTEKYAELYEQAAEGCEDDGKRDALRTYAACLRVLNRELSSESFPDLEGHESLLRTLTAQDLLERAIDEDRKKGKSGYALLAPYAWEYTPVVETIDGARLLALYERKSGRSKREIMTQSMRPYYKWESPPPCPSLHEIQDPPYDSPEFFSEETMAAAARVAAFGLGSISGDCLERS